MVAPKKSVKGPIIAVAAVVILALAIMGIGFSLGWFGQKSHDGGGEKDKQPKTASEPIYVVTKQVKYDTNGSVNAEYKTTYNEHGNKEQRRIDTEWEHKTVEYAYDENDQCVGTTTKYDEGKEKTEKWENEIVPPNRIVSCKGSTWTEEYEYYESGALKSSKGSDFDGSYFFVYEIVYDENGYPIEENNYEAQGDKEEPTSHAEYDWEFDSQGFPVSCTYTYTYYGTNSNDVNAEIVKFTCDKDGNIIEIRNEKGNVIETREYQKIEDPSISARTFTHKL